MQGLVVVFSFFLFWVEFRHCGKSLLRCRADSVAKEQISHPRSPNTKHVASLCVFPSPTKGASSKEGSEQLERHAETSNGIAPQF
jgi:hypothetical protein